MLKQPNLKSLGLYISVIQDRPERGAFSMFVNMFKNSSTIREKFENYIYPINAIITLTLMCDVVG